MNQGIPNNQPMDNQNLHEPQSKSNLAEPSKIKKMKTKQTLQNEPEEDEDQVYERVKQSRFKQTSSYNIKYRYRFRLFWYSFYYIGNSFISLF